MLAVSLRETRTPMRIAKFPEELSGESYRYSKNRSCQCAAVQPVRNKLNLADPKQVRLLKKRLQLSEQELNVIVGKLGNSISAITKEAAAHLLPG
jgi:hypothetical protein